MNLREKPLTLALFIFLLFQIQAIAQSDSLELKKQDSMLIATQAQGKELLHQADSSLKVDSMTQIDLVSQIESLRSGEKKKKEKLQNQLDSIQLSITLKNDRIKRQVDSIKNNTIGVPVVFNRDTLFNIYSKLGPFSPSERALAIQDKINIISSDFNAELLTVIHGEETSDIYYDQIIVLSIMERDAFWVNKDRKILVDEYKSLLITSIEKFKEETSLFSTLWRVGMIILVIAILILLVRYLNKFFSKIVRYVGQKGKIYLKGIKIKNYELLTYEHQLRVVIFLLNATKWFIILAIVYVALPIIFSVFPTTESIANKLIGYVLTPFLSILKSLIGYIPELITIAVIILVTRYFVKFIRFLSKEIEQEKLVIPGFYADWAKPTYNLLSFIIHAFAFIVIFPYLPGSDSPVFQGVSVFLGLLISLGSSSAIGNMIAGLVITYMRPFKLGDRVKIGDTIGDVIEKTMLVTRVRTIKNEDITIPNAAILNGQTTNYSTSAKNLGLILNTSITIGYDVHWTKVKACLIEAALKTGKIEKEPEPFVLQTSLDDFYVSYQINAYTHEAASAAKIYSELHSNILDVFHDSGIEIMSPHFRAERDGSPLQAPAENSSKTTT